MPPPGARPHAHAAAVHEGAAVGMEELFVVYPLGAMRFFRKIIIFGFVTGMMIQLPLVMFLHAAWEENHFCARVLRWYHVCRGGMFLLQIPLRAFVLARLHRARGMETREEVVAALVDMVHSVPWRVNQFTGIVAYFLFAFAIIFAFCGRSCSSGGAPISVHHLSILTTATTFPSSGLYYGLLANILMFSLHMLASLVWLGQVLREDAFEASTWRNGVTAAKLERFTTVVTWPEQNDAHDGQEDGEQGGSHPRPQAAASSPRLISGIHVHERECAICFGEYVHPQQIRVLACAHSFHKECCDSWLQRKKQCPLCQRSLDAPRPATDFTSSVFSPVEGLRKRAVAEGHSAAAEAAAASSSSSASSQELPPFDASLWRTSPLPVPCAGDPSNDRIVHTVFTHITFNPSADGADAPAPDDAQGAAAEPAPIAAEPAAAPSSAMSQSEADVLASLEAMHMGTSSARHTPACAVAASIAAPPSSLDAASAAAKAATDAADALRRVPVKQVSRPSAAASSTAACPSSAASSSLPLGRPAAVLPATSFPSSLGRAAVSAASKVRSSASSSSAPGVASSSSVLSSWRDQLDEWAEEQDEGEEEVRPPKDEDAEEKLVSRAADGSAPQEATQETKEEKERASESSASSSTSLTQAPASSVSSDAPSSSVLAPIPSSRASAPMSSPASSSSSAAPAAGASSAASSAPPSSSSSTPPIRSYAFRAECRPDVEKFLALFTGRYTSVKVVPDPRFPDVVVERLDTPCSLGEIRSVMAQIDDSHVMMESLNYRDKYDGDRWWRWWDSSWKNPQAEDEDEDAASASASTAASTSGPVCSACGKSKPRSEYASAQLKKSASARKCRACTSAASGLSSVASGASSSASSSGDADVVAAITAAVPGVDQATLDRLVAQWKAEEDSARGSMEHKQPHDDDEDDPADDEA